MHIAPLSPDDPSELGGYELLGRIGQGGMGQVYPGGGSATGGAAGAAGCPAQRSRHRAAPDASGWNPGAIRTGDPVGR